MKKIITAEQTRATDEFTVENEAISSLELMERASNKFVERFLVVYPEVSSVCVFCGTGNNGGDGFAIARLLQRSGVEAKACLVQFSDTLSPDCQRNFDRLGKTLVLREGDHVEINCDLVIDAVFGSGLNRPVVGDFQDVQLFRPS